MSKRMSYSEKLKDPRWQKLRLECFERDQFMCQHCCSSTDTLHAHHRKYFGDPWGAPLEYLTTLCENCHKARTEIDKDLFNAIRCLQNEFFFKEHGDGGTDFVRTREEVLVGALMGLIQELQIIVLSNALLSQGIRDHLSGMLHAASKSLEYTLDRMTFFSKIKTTPLAPAPA